MEAGRTLRVLVADDEAPARATLRRLLSSDPEIEVVGETWGSDAPRVIESTRPDLLLLDIQMPGLDGFGVLDAIPNDRRPFVIFVTAYDEYAVEAFDVRALDYVLKPFRDDRFRVALGRAKEAIHTGLLARQRDELAALLRQTAGQTAWTPEELAESPLDPLAGQVVLRDGGRMLFIERSDIDWIEAVGSYVRIHAGDTSRLVRATLTGLESALEAHGFFRIHRSALVNLTCISETRHESHGDWILRLKNGTRLRLSRTRRAAFHEATGLANEA